MNSQGLRLLPALMTVSFACAPAEPTSTPVVRERGLSADPSRLAFTCVTPGCDTAQTIRVSVMGERRVAIKRIQLEDESGDFTMISSEEAPFILGVESSFTLDVRYTPQGAPSSKNLEVAVTYTDASPVESDDRIPPGVLKIPLVRRLVGEPVLVATPSELAFGAVSAATEKTLEVELSNGGFGNVAVEIAKVESEHASFRASMPVLTSLVPGAKVGLPVTFAPAAESYVRSRVVVTPSVSDVEPAIITVEGTSISTARIALDPAKDVSFGELARTKQKTLHTTLVNQGGVDLNIAAVSVTDASGNVSVALAGGQSSATLPPLGKVGVDILINGVNAGGVNAEVTVTSDDPQTPALKFRVVGTITEPRATLSPGTIDFGIVPMGWVVTRPVEIRNTGYGALTVKNVILVSGSSTLFTLKNLPSLPAVLERDQRMAVDVEFRSEAAATFAGFVSVESDDPVMGFREVSLAAEGGTCQAGCPIANGTPDCASGSCAVGSCNTGWYDTDQSATNGCECREVGTDPGAFCTSSIYKGTLSDSGSSSNHTGIIPQKDDIDLIRFFAEDKFQWFSDDFDVRISLSSTDPGIFMCVYRHGTGSHDNDCYFSSEVCGVRSFRKDSSGTGDDGADFIIKVYRTATSTPTCTSYTVFMNNG
ncbi:MAG: choice-of-anchor D domain-containing protein [Myxococcota bacterium]